MTAASKRFIKLSSKLVPLFTSVDNIGKQRLSIKHFFNFLCLPFQSRKT